MTFDPNAFVGRAATELEMYLQDADQDAISAEWHGKSDAGVVIGYVGGSRAEPVDVQTVLLLRNNAATDLPKGHPKLSVPDVDILEYLGGGQFGWVFAAKVRTSGLVVALKVLRNVHGDDTPRRAANEAILGARLKHRNIMNIFDLRPVGKYWILLMELVVGTSLSKLATKGDDVKRLFGFLSDAVAHLGMSRVVHRDLKPENIVLRRLDRSPVIVDFGLAVDLDLVSPRNVGISGTPLFVPPEAFDGEISNAFDAYSLGVTAAKVVTGAFPAIPRNLQALIECKKSGQFRETLIEMLNDTDEVMANWISRMIDDDKNTRLDALNTARAWINSVPPIPESSQSLTATNRTKRWWQLW